MGFVAGDSVGVPKAAATAKWQEIKVASGEFAWVETFEVREEDGTKVQDGTVNVQEVSVCCDSKNVGCADVRWQVPLEKLGIDVENLPPFSTLR